MWQAVLAKAIRASTAIALIWLMRIRTRQRLRELDTRQLDDVGLTELRRRRECMKRFWRA
jgi:uncharacterized protein YjiS (DUF1127 family)